MNRNQRRAIELARAILAPGGSACAAELPDGDWALLLLAADLHNTLSLPPLVAHRVLDQAAKRRGYFATTREGSDRITRDAFARSEPSCGGGTYEGLGGRLAAPPATRLDGFRPLKILVVDDHADTARLLNVVFRAAGFDVQSTHSVAAARLLARSERFDLLVSESGLPDGDGCDLLRDMLTLYPVRGIALTGYGQPADRARCARAGFRQYLLKPVSLDQLREAVNAAADGLTAHTTN